ncbi:MAG: hypothetical protein ACYTDX_05970, partial [Planctomycetota bacterium]
MRMTTVMLAAAMVLLAAGTAHAQNRGIVHVPGDKDSSAILPAGDTDTFVFEVAEDSVFSVALSAAKGTPLLPTISMKRPDGSEVSAAELTASKYKPGKSKVKLKKFHIDVTGRWSLTVGGSAANQAGGYTLATKIKFPKKLTVKDAVLPQNGELELELPMAGEVTFTLKFKNKNKAATGLTQPV